MDAVSFMTAVYKHIRFFLLPLIKQSNEMKTVSFISFEIKESFECGNKTTKYDCNEMTIERDRAIPCITIVNP